MKHLFLSLILLISLPDTASAQKFLDKVLKGVEKTNKILDETDKMFGVDNSSQSSTRGKQTGGFQIVSPHPDIEIQFKRCIMSGSTVIMDLVITNYGKDASIQLGGSSETRVYDDLGNQYTNTKVSIAEGNMSNWEQALFPTEVPLKFRMQISDVSSKATAFKRINLNIYCKTIKFEAPVIFYNVPITKRDNSVNIVPEENTSPNKSQSSYTGTLPLTASNLAGTWKLISEKEGNDIIDCSDKKCTITFDDKCNYKENFGDELSLSSFVISENQLKYFCLLASGNDRSNDFTVKVLTTKTLVITFIDSYHPSSPLEREFTFSKTNL